MTSPDEETRRVEADATPLENAGLLGANTDETTVIRQRPAPADETRAEEPRRQTSSLQQRMRTAGIKVDLDLGLWRGGMEVEDGTDLEDTVIVRGGAAGPEGEMLDRYRIVDELGKGGMGVVHLVEDGDLGRLVAAKVLPEEITSDERIRRFLLEARISGQLQHPGIIPVYELGLSDEQRIYFTMKRVQGSDLGTRIAAAQGKIGASDKPAADYRRYLRRSLEALLKVCDALMYAHSQGVIHRDLKPSNIMAGRYGEVIVMDWGLAKVLGDKDVAAPGVTLARTEEAQEDGLVTLDGTIVGTPAYMPPEQAKGNVHEVDHRGDVYSLGAILYEILCFAPPYRGTNAVNTLHRVLGGKRRKPSEVRPDLPVPWELEGVINRAMSREPDRRYRTVDSMREDLDRYLVGGELAAVSYTTKQRLAKWLGRNRLLVGAGAVVAVGLLIAGVFAFVSNMRALGVEREARAGLQTALDDVRRERDARQRALDETRRARDDAHASAKRAGEASATARRQLARALIDRAVRATGRDRPQDAAAFLAAAAAHGQGPALRAAHMLAWPSALRHLSARQIGNEPLCALAISADGKHLAIGDERGAIQVRARDSLALLWQVSAHDLAIDRLFFGGEDGRWLVSVGRHRVRCWDWRAGRGRTIEDIETIQEDGSPTAMAVHGATLACADRARVRLYDLTKAGAPSALPRHRPDAPIRALAFNREGTVLLDGAMRGDEKAGARERAVASGRTGNDVPFVALDLIDCAYTADRRWVFLTPGRVAISEHKSMRLEVFDAPLPATPKTLLTTQVGGQQRIVVVGFDGLAVYTADGQPLGEYLASGWRARCAVAHGARLLVGTREGALIELELQDRYRGHRPYRTPQDAPRSITATLARGAAGLCLIHDEHARRLTLVLRNGRPIELDHDGAADSWGFTPDGKTLVVRSSGRLSRWDAATGKALGEALPPISASSEPELTVVDRDTLVLQDDDGLYVWRSKQKVRRLPVPSEDRPVGLSALGPGLVVFSRAAKRTIELWDAVAGKRVWSVPHRGAVSALRASPDGRWLAIGGEDGRVELLDLADRTKRPRLLGAHSAAVELLAWSPDSAILASTGYELGLRIWDARSGAACHPPMRMAVAALAIDRRGLVLVTEEGWYQRRGIPLTRKAAAGVVVEGARLVPGKSEPAPR